MTKVNLSWGTWIVCDRSEPVLGDQGLFVTEVNVSWGTWIICDKSEAVLGNMDCL